MNSDTQFRTVGWAKVPHGIVDTAIADTLKLLLWHCYDKHETWKLSVPKVARSLGKSPQCIRAYFRKFLHAGVFTKSGNWPSKHGLVPLYSFHPEKVDAFIRTQLEINPEADPETNAETDSENDPTIGSSHNNNNIQRTSTEKTHKKKESTNKDGTIGIDGPPSLNSSSSQNGMNLAKEFEGFLQDASNTTPSVPSNPSIPQAAEGGIDVGVPSMPLADSVPSIQSANGNSNSWGKDKPYEASGCDGSGVIGSANGGTNTAAQGRANHAEASAAPDVGAVTTYRRVSAPMPKDAEWCAERLIRSWKGYRFTPESLRRMETEFRKQLAEYDWSTCPSSYLAMSEVKRLKEKVQKEFGDYGSAKQQTNDN